MDVMETKEILDCCSSQEESESSSQRGDSACFHCCFEFVFHFHNFVNVSKQIPTSCKVSSILQDINSKNSKFTWCSCIYTSSTLLIYFIATTKPWRPTKGQTSASHVGRVMGMRNPLAGKKKKFEKGGSVQIVTLDV